MEKRNRIDGACADALQPSLGQNCRSCPVLRSGFCGKLPVPTLRQLADRSMRVSLAAHSSIPAIAARPGFYIAIRGYLGTIHVGADGHRRISSVTLPGENFSLPGDDHASEVETLTEVEFCQIHPASYRSAFEDADFRRAVYEQTRAKLDRLRLLTLALGAMSPEERFITFLVNCLRIMPWQPLPWGGGILTMEVDRADIADLLGTTVETLSRITHRLDEIGLIRIRDPRHFEIPDPKVLRARVSGWIGAAEVAAPAEAGISDECEATSNHSVDQARKGFSGRARVSSRADSGRADPLRPAAPREPSVSS